MYLKSFICALAIACALPQGATAYNIAKTKNKTGKDTVTALSEVAVVAKMKQKNDLRQESLSSTTIKLGDIERKQIVSLQDASSQVPNLHIPQYGSRMTSSIYVRGLGSRIDHPAVGMYVDNIPLMNKNSFDAALWDIMRMEVLRGPQSTLYGRNTVGGIINMYTLSPDVYQGARISAGYSSGETYNIKGSAYFKPSNKIALSIGGNYLNSGGFFENEYTGEKADWEEAGSGRFRFIYTPNSRLKIDNSFIFGKVDQGGYAYRPYDAQSGEVAPVSYNDKSGYERTTLLNGLSINYTGNKVIFSSTTTWQYLDDCMTLDQDFSPADIFTLQQAQHENTITQDFVIKRAQAEKKWQWLSGITLFYKDMEMDAPVRFKEDGINSLILENINEKIHKFMPQATLSFKEKEFDLNSNFQLPVFGAAAYHQSQFTAGKFTFTAGLRLDYEKTKIDYNSNTAINYILPPSVREYKLVESKMAGELEDEYFEVLPKFGIQYTLGRNGNIYASVTRGFKAGGYNTQMFSDILQNQLKRDMILGMGIPDKVMDMIGLKPDAAYSPDEIIAYKPEYSWNWEVGAHLNFLGGKLIADAALFYIDCTDQQLTVFPDGQTTGRMMTNAGKTKSLGAELSATAQVTPALDLGIAYGHTSAEFVKYDDGIHNYKGNKVPYVPQNTFSANASYTFWSLGNVLDKLQLRAGYNGTGKIWWNEENTSVQDFYSLLSASIYAEKGKFSLELWGKNLTDTNYNAFHFVSMGNTFFSQGRPAEWGVTVTLQF